MQIHVGAYAASAGLDEAGEKALYAGLADLNVAGLEQPYFGSLHRRDDAWLMAQIRSEWSLIITTLPGTMDRLAEDAKFGLASADTDARKRALDFVEGARRAVARLHATLGRRAVRAVMVHSSPRLDGWAGKASLEGFADSLSDLRGRDWQGATLLVEHCDAALPGKAADKGFLRIEDDALAVKMSSGATPAGLAINWGRSALEARSAEGPIAHLARAVQAELLGALIFSGVTPSDAEYGEWRDSHAPFSTACPNSLLTPASARAALAAAPGCPLLALKIQTKPASLSVARRLAVIADGLDALR